MEKVTKLTQKVPTLPAINANNNKKKDEAAAAPATPAPAPAASSSNSKPAATPAAAPAEPTKAHSSSSSSGKPSGTAAMQPWQPPCDADGLYCRDKISSTSTMFGTKPKSGQHIDQAWLAGKARLSAVKMYYNTTSGCLRGLQLTFKHTAAAGAAGAAAAGTAPVVQLLGSGYTHASVAVRELVLKGDDEIIGKAEIWDPK